MNQSTLTSLKVIIERAVRPVRASTFRKRKMREELLAHVEGVFKEESAKLRDERAALERTAQRFGNPAELSSQLQETVPARDAVRRYWEGRPGEPAWRTATRMAWVSGTFTLVVALLFFAVTSFSVATVSAWPREPLILFLCAVLTIPAWLSGLVFLTSSLERALYGPAGRSWLTVAVVVAGSWLCMVLWFAAWIWPIRFTEWNNMNANLLVLAGFGLVLVPLHASVLARSSLARRRYLEEWGCLPVEMPS